METRASFQRRSWILVANGSRARLFSYQTGEADLTPIREFDFPEGRAKGIELVTDRPGALQAQGTGHGTRRPALTPHENAQQHFARELVHHLEAGWANQQYGHLLLVASLPFLGVLSAALPPALASRVKAHIERDATRASASELRDLVLPALRERRSIAG